MDSVSCETSVRNALVINLVSFACESEMLDQEVKRFRHAHAMSDEFASA
jgi:hypothetical protein